MNDKNILTGFADEAGSDIDTQIKATQMLGWKYIEARNIDGVNIHNLPIDKFEIVCSKLEEAGIQVYCFGSEVANWAKDPLNDDDFKSSIEELERAIDRMEILGTKFLRAMSFRRFNRYNDITPDIERKIFSKIEYLVKMCEDAGVFFLHENCMNYGGMSYQHTLKLLENINSSALKLVFDTGNPVITYDYSKKEPYPKQDPMEFYRNVRDFIGHIHIKDPVYLNEGRPGSIFPNAEYHFPGEGDAKVREITYSLLQSGYKGAFSIEPHMNIIFHKSKHKNQISPDTKFENYIQYGKYFINMVDEITLNLS